MSESATRCQCGEGWSGPNVREMSFRETTIPGLEIFHYPAPKLCGSKHVQVLVSKLENLVSQWERSNAGSCAWAFYHAATELRQVLRGET